jgi:hypothetical protein
MTACFTDEPDLTPYEVRGAGRPLNELTEVQRLTPAMRRWVEATAQQDFAGFDRADEDTLNRILWHAAKGQAAPYPAEFAGSHGRGLAARGLTLEFVDAD